MSDRLSKLSERIRFHYEKQTNIEKFMDVRRAEIQNFEPIPYLATVDRLIPEKDFEIDDLSQHIGLDVANCEFSHFGYSLKKIPCKTVKTTLDEMIEMLDQTHDELWDLGFNVEQLFMPGVLKNEIRKRKRSVGIGINFSTQNINPNTILPIGRIGKDHPSLLLKKRKTSDIDPIDWAKKKLSEL